MPSFNFIGTKIRCINYAQFRNFVENWFEKKNNVHIAVVNAYCTVLAHKNKYLSDIYSQAELVVPDGRPFVIWMNIFGNQKVQQFDATNVLLKLIEYAKEINYGFYFYGGSESVLENMLFNLKEKYSHINISGSYSPPFRELSLEEKRDVINKIKKSGARIICVGLGTPKQDKWILEHKKEFSGVMFIPCGAIFDFFGGRIKKAPAIVSYLGFEWLYRLFSKDFIRLFRRYTIDNIYFLFHFFLQKTGLNKY
tara:strand:- start:612 stop:1367 length:756 start_codon:yes stop_codon:yes gene_type:complete